MVTLRKRTKTSTYFKESSDLLDFNNHTRLFNKLYLTRINEDKCPKESLNDICNRVYDNISRQGITPEKTVQGTTPKKQYLGIMVVG